MILLAIVCGISILGKWLPQEPLHIYFGEPHFSQPQTLQSIFIPGFRYWFYAIITSEALTQLFPRYSKSSFARDGHANPFNRWLVALVLGLTFISSWSQWTQIRSVLGAPDILIYQPIVAAIVLTAGTAICIQLGYLLELRWRNYGYWLLYFFYVEALSAKEVTNWLRELSGSLNSLLVFKCLALTAIISTCSVLLVHLRNSRQPKDEQGLYYLIFFVSECSFIFTSWASSFLDPTNDRIKYLPIVGVIYFRWAILALILGWLIFLREDTKSRRVIQLLLILIWFGALHFLQKEDADFLFLSSPIPLVAAWAVMSFKEAIKTSTEGVLTLRRLR